MSDVMLDKLKHHWNVSSRRDFFTKAGSGLAGIALAAMLAENGYAEAVDPLAPKTPTVKPRAKNIIWCFMEGGPEARWICSIPSRYWTSWHSNPCPASFHPETLLTAQGAKPSDGLVAWRGVPSKQCRPERAVGIGLASQHRSARRRNGRNPVVYIRRQQSRRRCMPDEYRLYSRRGVLRMGAWLTYGLGSAQRNLPTFVVMQDDKEILGAVQNYGSGFLPATYQGSLFRQGDTPILNLKPPVGTTDEQQRNKIAFLEELNERFGHDKQDDTELDARTRSYELAYQMQSSAPEAVDLSKESEATRKLYGMDEPETKVYGANCLMARRLVERGVRFVESLQRLRLRLGQRTPRNDQLEPHQVDYCKASDAKPKWRFGAPRILRPAACWRTRWWCGAASSAALHTRRLPPDKHRKNMGATTTPGVSRCGWRAAA